MQGTGRTGLYPRGQKRGGSQSLSAFPISLVSIRGHPCSLHESIVTIPHSPSQANTEKQTVPATEPSVTECKRPRWTLLVFWLYSYSDSTLAVLLLIALAISRFAIPQGPVLLGQFNFIDSS